MVCHLCQAFWHFWLRSIIQRQSTNKSLDKDNAGAILSRCWITQHVFSIQKGMWKWIPNKGWGEFSWTCLSFAEQLTKQTCFSSSTKYLGRQRAELRWLNSWKRWCCPRSGVVTALFAATRLSDSSVTRSDSSTALPLLSDAPLQLKLKRLPLYN